MHYPNGFTIIEVLVVLGLVGIVSAFGLFMGLNSVTRSSVQTERDHLVSLAILSARAHAIANVDHTAHGLYIDNVCDRYILFTGASYTPPTDCTPPGRSIPFSDKSHYVTNIPGGPTIIFTQRSGNIVTGTSGQATSTITISNGIATETITISAVGQIDW